MDTAAETIVARVEQPDSKDIRLISVQDMADKMQAMEKRMQSMEQELKAYKTEMNETPKKKEAEMKKETSREIMSLWSFAGTTNCNLSTLMLMIIRMGK